MFLFRLGNIINAIEHNGESVCSQPLIKSMCTLKKDILKLISEFFSKATNFDVVMESLVPPLMDTVLMDYESCPFPSVREPQVLSTMTTLINRLEGKLTEIDFFFQKMC